MILRFAMRMRHDIIIETKRKVCDPMEVSERAKRHVEAVKKHQTQCDAITIRPKKEYGQAIREAAKAAGQSLQQYIFQAIEERIERENQP